MDDTNVVGSIPPEICELRADSLEKFLVDCPTSTGNGVGVFVQGSLDELIATEENCFTICRRAT